jgi:aspartate/methionine/tyrosine aminotransferase
MERLVFDGREVIHPAKLPRMLERVITVGSASKEVRMMGWRVGWIVGPEKIMKDIEITSLANFSCGYLAGSGRHRTGEVIDDDEGLCTGATGPERLYI